MQCPKCQFDNPEEMQFCGRCGNKLANICPKCQSVNPTDFQFCGKCGTKLTDALPPPKIKAPKLEDMHSQLQRFIPSALAQRLSTAQKQLEGENRLVTVLFADISGFTPMSQSLTTEAVVEKVNQCFKAVIDTVYRYEGSINRFIGDCALTFFGAPVAHENDPERAILAALDMRQEVSKLGLNISVGINTGMMYFGPIGTQEHLEISAYGPDINLAKRLQEAAKAGQILIGSGIHRLTRKTFDFNRLDALTLKGIESPVIAYEVLKVKDRPEKLRGLEGLRAQMIGRDREFADLKEAADQWLAGQGQIVSIIGEAGIGKSRLVSELKTYIQGRRAEQKTDEEQGSRGAGERKTESPESVESFSLHLLISSSPHQILWLEGRCVSIGQPISYWPFLDILKTYFNLSESDRERDVARKVTKSVQKLFPQSSDDILPFLGHLLAIKFGNDLDRRLQFATPDQIRHQTLMRLKDLFVTLAKEQPLLLIFEDLHWADDLSLDLISLLMDELITTPLKLLCIYRPEREHRVWQLSNLAQRKCLDRYTEITLKKLSSRESRQLVEALLTIDNLPESVKAMILQKSEGNPFFIEEVIRSLIDRDIIYREGEGWKARAEVVEIEVPDTIQGVILTRVDRLKAEAKYVLQCASVIGRLFKYRLLEHLAKHERDLDKYIDEFKERELVYEERTVPELEYAFRHALTQEATYQGILERRRREFHQQVAEGIEASYQERIGEFYEQLAYHYDKSGVIEKAVEYLLKAGEKARKAYLNDEAISHFRRALERTEAMPASRQQQLWRLEALHGLGGLYHQTGKGQEAEEHFRQAITLGQNLGLPARELARPYSSLCNVFFLQGRWDETIRLAEEGLALLGQDTESVEACHLYQQLGYSFSNKGNRELARQYQRRIAQIIERVPYSREVGGLYGSIVWLYGLDEKQVDEAFRWIQRGERLAQQHHNLESLALMQCWRLRLWGGMGDFQNVISHFTGAIDQCTAIGATHEIVWVIGSYTHACLSMGNLQEVRKWAQIERDLRQGSGYTWWGEAWPYTLLSTISLCEGAFDEAVALIEEALRLYQDPGIEGRDNSVYVSGQAYLAQGNRQLAIQRFQEALKNKNEWLRPSVLSSLEEAYDDPEEFRAFCRRFKEEHPDAGGSAFVQWYLEPTTNFGFRNADFGLEEDNFENLEAQIRNPQSTIRNSKWIWHDPFGDCSFKVQNGLEIQAANGRDFWHINLSAPRILQPVSGDFAVQTVCVPVSESAIRNPQSAIENPSIGGILLWKDKENYLRLDKGTRGIYEISFQGCIKNKDVIIGRGKLPVSQSNQSTGEPPVPLANERVFLRLERLGSRVNALCSADGIEWFTVGHVEFPVADPIEVGLHAIGNIDRTIYHGAFPEGAAIRFESFDLFSL